MRYLDSKGRERLRIERSVDGELVDSEALQDKSGRYYFRRGMELAQGGQYFSPIDRNIEHGEVEVPTRFVFRVAAAVYSSRSQTGFPMQQGVVVINLNAEELFGALRPLRVSKYVEMWIFGARGRAGEESPPTFADTVYVREFSTPGQPVFTFGTVGDGVGADILNTPDRGAAIEVGDSIVGAYRISLPPPWQGYPWTIAVTQPTEIVVGPVDRMLWWLTGLAGLFALLSVVAALFASRTLSVPLERLAAHARQVSAGDLLAGFQVETGDEIEDLGDTLTGMARQLRTARGLLEADNEALRRQLETRMRENERLLQERMAMERQILKADRLASLGLLSTTLAHEIGNPLAGIQANLELAGEHKVMPVPAARAISRAAAEISRLGEILKRVTGFARLGQADVGPTAAQEVIADVWELVSTRAQRAGVSFALSAPDNAAIVPMDKVAFRQLCLNLLLNSLQAEPSPKRIEVHIEREQAGIVLRFVDDGPGIEDDRLDTVFDLLYTTRNDGTGLGLPIVRRLCGEYGATVIARRADLGGAEIRIWFAF